MCVYICVYNVIFTFSNHLKICTKRENSNTIEKSKWTSKNFPVTHKKTGKRKEKNKKERANRV